MNMREVWEKFELYIISLWFLFFLIIVITIDVPICFSSECSFVGLKSLLLNNIIPLVALLFLFLGTLFYFRFDYRISGGAKLSSNVEKIEDLNYEHLTFLTTYIIPLICFNLTSIRYAIALVILLILIGVIYVKTDKFYSNPTLAVLGFKLYKIDLQTRTEFKKNIVVITRDKLNVDSKIVYKRLDEKVYFAKVTNNG